MFFLSLGILNWLISVQTSNVDAEEGLCSDWKLYGGHREYEGIVMVNYSLTNVNLCYEKNLTTQTICRKIKSLWSGSGYNSYVGNVFDVTLTDKAISHSCKGKETKLCGADDKNDCCQPIGVCCADVGSGEICSASWVEMYNRTCHYSKEGDHLDYFKIRSSKIIKDFSAEKAWTKSALNITRQTCNDTKVSRQKDVLKQCANKCLNPGMGVVVNSATDKCRCTSTEEGICNCTQKHNGSKCTVDFEVLRRKSEQPDKLVLCIAGSVTNGKIKFTAEDCGRFLQPLCLKIESVDEQSSSDDHEVRSATPMIITISCLLVLSVFTVLLICKCRTCGQKRDSFRSSSMFNRTYGRQLQRENSINEEEYAIISDIELDSGTSFYKPRLPERNNLDPTYNKIEHDGDRSRADIVALDEYSSPSDMIKDKDLKYDPASEYTITYDDPIRHNEQNVAECKRKSKVKDSLDNQALETDNGLKIPLESNDDKKVICVSYESIADTSKTAAKNRNVLVDLGGQENQTAEKDGKVMFDSGGQENKTTEEDEKVLVVLGGQENKSDINSLESKEGIVEGASSKYEYTQNDKVPESGCYEDTNLIDGNFPTKPKHIFEEHICLNCLKPEHLERLGIRIITDDKALESIESESLEDEAGDDKSLDNSIDSDRNISSENVRECVICKNVYDCLGNLKKCEVTKLDGNEYDKLRNYKESVL